MSESIENAPPQKAPPSVPRWLVRTIWIGHRALYSITGGRVGLRGYTATQWGMLRLKTVGRQTGKERVAIVGYIEDGAEPRHPGHERLGRSRAGLVAQPPGEPRGRRRAARRVAPGRRARRGRRRAPAALGDVPRARLVGLHRRQCGAPVSRDRARHLRAGGGVGLRRPGPRPDPSAHRAKLMLDLRRSAAPSS